VSRRIGTPQARVSAVVLAYGAEPLLPRCVQALLDSAGVCLDVVVVDNGCTSGAVDEIRHWPGVHVLTPSRNLGFTGGCNLGASRSTGDALVLVNSDAVVEPGAVGALVSALDDPSVGIASASLRLMDRPETLNSAGNPVHYLGLSWAGGLGEPASSYDEPRSIPSASGAVMAMRRTTWDQLGGFFEPMFAYAEDAELSLRCWQRGLSVRFVPEAVALHAYEFNRHGSKMYLLERNRLLLVLTLYERRTLALLLPALMALEVAVLWTAVRQRWWRQKIRGWLWLVRHVRCLRRRRIAVQRARTVADAELVPVLTARFEPGQETGFRAPALLTTLSCLYWKFVSSRMRSGSGRGAHRLSLART
jgi:GT2 family glycosyltransferase